MTSFAATMFLASLLAVGVLMVTLLIALSVMLQNCENRNSGIVGGSEANRELLKHFGSTRAAQRHGSHRVPSICRDIVIHHIKHGVYQRELNFTIQMALAYFESITPLDDNLDAVLIDIDEVLALKQQDHSHFMLQLEQDSYRKYIEEAKYL